MPESDENLTGQDHICTKSHIYGNWKFVCRHCSNKNL